MNYLITFVLRRSFMIEQSTTHKDGKRKHLVYLGKFWSLEVGHIDGRGSATACLNHVVV